MALVIHVADHRLLRVAAFTTHFPAPLGEFRPDGVPQAGNTPDAPVQRDEPLRQAVRDMLRAGGYKPTGRGKPASEYLVRAVEEGGLDSINVAVDVCNAVSFQSGFPVSVVDMALLEGDPASLRIDVAGEGERYVFNRAGHEIDLAGLICLFDAAGPCANAVKDAQRTKTGDDTVATLSIVWGVAAFPAHLAATADWYQRCLLDTGATVETVIAP